MEKKVPQPQPKAETPTSSIAPVVAKQTPGENGPGDIQNSIFDLVQGTHSPEEYSQKLLELKTKYSLNDDQVGDLLKDLGAE